MKLSEELSTLIGKLEDESLDYKAVLPPARNVARIISAFANTNGGFLILGVVVNDSEVTVHGLSTDFRAIPITQKAISLLSPEPRVEYKYITHNQKQLFIIQVEKSDTKIVFENEVYIRKGREVILSTPSEKEFRPNGYNKIQQIFGQLESYKQSSTESKVKLIKNYQSVLKIIDDSKHILYPDAPTTLTTNQEGKILIRILFSSCADNFEVYLSDLLYEIYLAIPSSLKSNEQVTIKEVLDCNDLQEFVEYWAKKKLHKLQRGSVKGFLADNKQISSLNVINNTIQDDMERLLQIRHLYTHRNGIIDEKFLEYYPQNTINTEHRLTIEEVLGKVAYLSGIINQIDKEAIVKYRLATTN